jgi:hypothetical protein
MDDPFISTGEMFFRLRSRALRARVTVRAYCYVYRDLAGLHWRFWRVMWRMQRRVWRCYWRILIARQPGAPWVLLAAALWPVLWLAARLWAG